MTARCKICHGSDDVREDRLCRCCYDLRQAEARGLTYGKYISRFGSNLGRRGEAVLRPVRVCRNCGAPVPPRSRLFCSPACCRKYWNLHRIDASDRPEEKGGD